MGGICDNQESNLNGEHPFPRFLRYMRRNNIQEVDAMEFRVYIKIEDAVGK